jgi:hypothetical protein
LESPSGWRWRLPILGPLTASLAIPMMALDGRADPFARMMNPRIKGTREIT